MAAKMDVVGCNDLLTDLQDGIQLLTQLLMHYIPKCGDTYWTSIVPFRLLPVWGG